MKTFEKISFIKECEVKELFDFHLNVENLKHITPPDIKVNLLSQDFHAHQGAILRIETTKYFIPTLWEVQIQKLQSPNILIDVALKSPFTFWEHSHIFTQKEGGCELKDIIKYELPLGRIGALFDFFIQKQLQQMFDFRHTVTAQILSQSSKSS
jgi:ligand-binding SRPBCC domain-containing protein